MNINLQGKTALITGSTSGIGLGIARELAAQGANVVLNGLGQSSDDLNAVLASFDSDKMLFCPADMRDSAAILSMLDDAVARFGAIDILVNNAGIQYVSAIEEFPDQKWQDIIAINLSSAFYTTKYAIPLMKKAGWGRVINVASAHGLVASPFKSAYVASKHGIVGFTKSVALEVAEHNITCNTICPGYVQTPLVDGQVKDQARVHNMDEKDVIEKIILAPQPTKKFIQVQDVADYALFLCSDAARHITGAALTMDGGWTAR
jgi:3-hydroxybutyrate dehydrogenase